ncbi:MAG: aspartate-semialdehyde dehydrogenase [Planctomycetes bacterium]|nr:aspartate-semialdehyde dehydrogenase [Planctomycetota bacterium]
MTFRVAIVGATGAVGTEFIRVLERRRFPVRELRLLASKRSAGTKLRFCGEELTVEELTPESFRGMDLALFSAGSAVSKQYREACVAAGCLMVDNSSAFRLEDGVPLVVPEVNPQEAAKALRARGGKGVIANPNCVTIIALVVLAPLHREAGIKRLVAATYQAASGAGHAAMVELQDSTRAYLEGRPYEPKVLPVPYAFNLFPHNSPWLAEQGYCEEELKLRRESHKILGDSSPRITATCVRVPVLRAHSEALNVEFARPLSVARAYEILRTSPGVKVFEDPARNRWPMPIDAAGRDSVLVGRIRVDQSQPNTLDLWVVGDQLLKGAALNAVQCAELALLGELRPNAD